MKYQVHVTWIPDGHFVVMAVDDRQHEVEGERLAFALFSHDPISWYGATIRITQADGSSGIELSSREGLRLFRSSDLWNSAVNYEWPPFFAVLQTMGETISHALATEGYVPDFVGYQQGQLKWKLRPEIAQNLQHRMSSLMLQDNLRENMEWSIERANIWLNACLQEEIETVRGRSRVQPTLFSLHPLLTMVPASTFHSEQEWWLALGYSEEGSVLEVLLEIVEPEEETDSFSLKIWVQDQSMPDTFFAAPGYEDTVEDEVPPQLKKQAMAAVEVATRIWKVLIPALEAREGEGGPYGLLLDVDGDDVWDLLTDGVPRLTDAGYRVLVPGWWQDIAAKKPRFSARVTASGKNHSLFGMAQMVEFDWRIAIGDVHLSEAEFLALVSRKQRLLRVRNQWIALNPDVIQGFRQVADAQGKGRHSTFREALEMMLTRGRQGEDASEPTEDDVSVEIRFDGELALLIQHLQARESMPLLPTPSAFRGELRAYQQVGFSWLMFLRKYGLGGCLADDMGLGKTIQYTAYLLHSRGEGQGDGRVAGSTEVRPPALLICPTSVLGNWQRELHRFAPELRVYLHYGPNRAKDEGFERVIEDYDVVLTSYTLCALDEDALVNVTWDSICLDEAQNIKNPHTKQAIAVRRIEGYHRIAMTGTPMENRLTELWSIFEFINPGYLGRMSQFVERFARPIERDSDPARVEQLQRLIAPFLLRRRKQDPEIDLSLPDKIEQTVHVPLSRDQAALYESIVSDLLRKVDTLSAMERRGLILASLTRLKQACDHPALLQPGVPFQYAKGQSAKLDRLLEMAGELLSEGDKCLIFTQFIQTGHIIQASMDTELGEPSLFLHGGLTKTARDAMVADFQSPTGSKVLILSLKAGGVGLNLTAANHVFHFDRWWNPAVENQATDRAYRIGQTKHVLVHKFVSLGTLEERIDEMIQRKLAVSTQVVSAGEQWITELSTEELTDLFELRQGMGLSEL